MPNGRVVETRPFFCINALNRAGWDPGDSFKRSRDALDAVHVSAPGVGIGLRY